MKLYIANKNYSSWSLRPWVLMREKGIVFEEIITPFADNSDVSPFKKFSPTGKVPCLDDNGTLVWDSLAICEYLAENEPACWPADRVARAWARCASAEMHSSFQTLRTQCQMNCGVRVTLNQIDDALRADIERVSTLFCDGLQRFGGPYLAGQTYTIVPGDTLWGVAQTFYGDGTRYMEIFNASNFRSGNPNLIFPGEIAVIP